MTVLSIRKHGARVESLRVLFSYLSEFLTNIQLVLQVLRAVFVAGRTQFIYRMQRCRQYADLSPREARALAGPFISHSIAPLLALLPRLRKLTISIGPYSTAC